MPDDLRIFPDDFVPNVQASDAYKRWARSSPVDRARWEAFRDALLANPATAVVPVMSTKFGKALVAGGREHMSISSLVGQVTNPYPPPGPEPGPTPPSGGLLTWMPPGYPDYTGYTVVHASNASHSFSTTPRQGANLKVIWDSPITDTGGTTRRLFISGYRNVVIIGGEVNYSTLTSVVTPYNVGIQIDKCDGIVHVEGVSIHGQGVIDAFVGTTGPEGSNSGATVRIQNCFFEGNSISGNHSDGIQIWGDPGGGFNGGFERIDIHNLTVHSSWQGVFLGTRDGCIKGGDFRNLNIVGIPAQGGATQTGLGWIFFKGRLPDIGGFLSTIYLTNCWADNSLRMWASIPNQFTPNTNGDDGEGNLNTNRRSALSSDSTGQFVHWPAAGSDIKGKFYWGRPPASLGGVPGSKGTTLGDTDFVPVNGNVGMSYVSPGYV